MRLSPARRRGVEVLDDPSVSDAVRARSLADVARANRWLGGRRAFRLALDDALRAHSRGRAVSILDVGCGAGDLARLAGERATRIGNMAQVIGLDLSPSLARSAYREGAVHAAVAADALALPFRDASLELVMCSQLLHHFEEQDAVRLVRELHRVARDAVVIADLRRSWIAAIGFWLVSWPFRFHAVTRHDGVVSVMRGFTAAELSALIERATGHRHRVRRRIGWRLAVVIRRSASLPEP